MPLMEVFLELEHVSIDRLQSLLSRQRAAFEAAPDPSIGVRKDHLRRLRAGIQRYQNRLCEAFSDDFEGRSLSEGKLTDILGPILEINHALRHLSRWMRADRRRTELLFFGNRSWVEYQPKGVV